MIAISINEYMKVLCISKDASIYTTACISMNEIMHYITILLDHYSVIRFDY